MPAVRTSLLLLFMMAAAPAAAASLFEDAEALEVELIGPIHSLFDSAESREGFPFVLRAGGESLNVEIRVRGKSRVKICKVPPLRLDFRRTGSGQGHFAGQGKLKLVTHCRRGDSSETNALEEYLAYRIFGLLSEVSYRVRLLHIRYTDTEGRVKTEPDGRFGFLIEPLDQLARRTGGVPVETDGLALRQLDPAQAALVYVFQYMIGNTDWSFATAEQDDACCHNGDLLEIGGAIHYVPYDFDLAGLVNASYAKPLPEMRLRSVRQRRYRGFCTDPETLRDAIHRVNERRDDIFRVIKTTPGLSDKEAEKAVDYLDGFFDKAEDEDKLLESFERQCIKG